MVQRYTHLSEGAVREAYDQTMTLEMNDDLKGLEKPQIREKKPLGGDFSDSSSEIESRKLKLFDLLIEGKISDERFEKLLSVLEGNTSRFDPRIELI